MRLLFAVILLIALHTLEFCYAVEKYDMSDLKVLANENNYQEFFQHALDIRPSSRGKIWENIVEEQAMELLTNLLGKSQLEKSDYLLVHYISKWPLFRENEFFIKKRDYIFLREIKSCFHANNSSQQCLRLTNTIFTDYQHDLIFSYELSSLMLKLGRDPQSLWVYAKKLVKSPLSEFYCMKRPFSKIILSQIFLVRPQKNTHENITLHPDCIKSLRPTILNHMAQSPFSVRKHAFNFLKKHTTLSKIELYEYYSLNFLQGQNLSSQEVDKSLQALRYYSNNYKSREKLLNKIKKLDPLPGHLFTKLNLKKNQAKLRTLNRFLPEYILYYSNTCLQYLKGTVKFKDGNPTPQCHQLFQSRSGQDLLPKSHLLDYKKATFFIR